MLIYSGKAVDERIERFALTNAERRQELHTIACSAVRLAARFGRANWLNKLHSKLDQLEGNALQSWFSTRSSDPIWGKGEWLQFSAKDGFTVIPGTETLRPSDKHIVMVESKVALSFVHKSARGVAMDTGWNRKLVSQAKNFYQALQKAEKENPASVPHYLVVEMEKVQHAVAVSLADDKVGVPLRKDQATDEQIEAEAAKMGEVEADIPEPHVIDADKAKPAEIKRGRGRAN